MSTQPINDSRDVLLSVRGLETHFFTEEGVVKAVNDVSFDVRRGETLGIVGESGSGKSVTNLSIMRLIPDPPGRIVGGQILFDGRDLRTITDEQMRHVRGKRIAMIFQDPMTSLNPFMRIGAQLEELTKLHLGLRSAAARAHAISMLEVVGIPDPAARIDDYPHQFSGGMRQRVMIAMALSCKPELLIADEPTTALDVTIQAQILELIRELKDETGTSVILITHDLGVVAGMTDKIIVMYGGSIMEAATTEDLFETPSNPYTRALLKSVPDPLHEQHRLFQIPGMPPDMSQLSPTQCPFAERCPEAVDACREGFPPVHEVGPDHISRCWIR
ncbi:MAG: ABC transporter ATP-binding protein [Blastocatellia bacterium]|nr:ABC transporter ATP-binding protein [Blastocatellia bacterium]